MWPVQSRHLPSMESVKYAEGMFFTIMDSYKGIFSYIYWRIKL